MPKLKQLSDDQLSQLATTAHSLIPLIDDRVEEIAPDGRFYWRDPEAHKKGKHWVWHKVELIGYNDKEELIFKFPDGICKNLGTQSGMEQTYILIT